MQHSNSVLASKHIQHRNLGSLAAPFLQNFFLSTKRKCAGYIFVEAFTKSCTTVYNVVSNSPLIVKAKSKRGGAAQTRPQPQEERLSVEERSSMDEAPEKEDLPLSEPSFADQLIRCCASSLCKWFSTRTIAGGQ